MRIAYVGWFDIMLRGLQALKYYNPEGEVWSADHGRARFVLLRVLRERQPQLVQIDVKGDNDLVVKMNKDLIFTDGKDIISDFLLRLQVFKSTADFRNGSELYEYYSKVEKDSKSGDDFLKIRKIVLKNHLPAKLLVQPNTFERDGVISIQEYANSVEGQLLSWRERFDDLERQELYTSLEKLHRRDLAFLTAK